MVDVILSGAKNLWMFFVLLRSFAASQDDKKEKKV